jgi:hypothetical protein
MSGLNLPQINSQIGKDPKKASTLYRNKASRMTFSESGLVFHFPENWRFANLIVA